MKIIRTYTITDTTTEDGSRILKRVNDGFTPLELLGAVSLVQNELIGLIHGKKIPFKKIIREVVIKDPP